VLGGNIVIRGAATPSTGCGASVLASGATGGAGVVAIVGAAAKRTREECKVAMEDSLAKRLTLAVVAVAAMTTPGDGNATAGGKPITFRLTQAHP